MGLVALGCLALLSYIWIGYPLIVRGLAAVARSRSVPREGAPATVSVVLATRDATAAIVSRVADLARAAYPAEKLEIIVALDARRDSEAVVLPTVGVPVHLVPGDTPGGKAATLNAGVRKATGDVLVFADAGQRFASDTIEKLTDALAENPRLGAVSGALRIDAPGASGTSLTSLYWIYERALRRWEARIHSTVGVTGAVYAMRRALWTPLPAGLILDDLFVPMQVVLQRRRVGFAEAAVATDARPFAPSAEYRRKTRTLTGVLQLCAWLPGVLNPVRNPIWIQFVSHKLLRLLTPYLLALMAVSGGIVLARSASGALTMMTLLWMTLAFVALLGIRKIREVIWSGLLMQAAVVRATLNALRGDWDVWSR